MPRRTSSPSPLRALSALALALLTTCVAGCLTADGTLERDGTGTLALSFQVPAGASEATVRALMTAPGVTVESFALAPNGTVSVKLKVPEVGAVGKIPLLKDVTVTDGAAGDDRILTIKAQNPEKAVENKALPGPKIRLTLPGKVVEASKPGKIDGSTVEWSFTLAEWFGQKAQELTARYHPATAGAPAADKASQKPAKPDAKTK
jgi:hypothetical protein